MTSEVDWSALDLNELDLEDLGSLAGIVGQIIGNVGGGYIDMDQSADTGGSAHASQSGMVIALGDGHTWAEAKSGEEERSWTGANVTTGAIILSSNNAASGASTSADQSGFVLGLYGNSTAGSTDGTNTTEVGAEISGGTLSLESIGELIQDPSNIGSFLTSGFGSGLIGITQNADTSSSAHAGQNGIVVAVAEGRTWGNASAGSDQSRTFANVTAGLITLASNNAEAGTSTSADQSLVIVGSKGSAWAESSDGMNYAKVGSGFNNTGTLAMYQETETTASAHAYQIGTVTSPGTTLGDVWTRAEAGNTSGRLTYVETLGNRISRDSSIYTYSSADSSNAEAEVNAYMLRSGSYRTYSITTAYAFNGNPPPDIDTETATYTGITIGNAWATDIGRDARV